MRTCSSLLIVATCGLLAITHAGMPISETTSHTAAELASNQLAASDTTPSPVSNSSCWLYRWRGMTKDDLKKQAIDWEKSLESSWGSKLFSVVLLCSSVLLMFGGWWLGPLLMFIVGLACGAASTFFLIDHIFNFAGWSNCILLGVGSLIGGLIAGFALLRMVNFGLFCLGAALGGVTGYWFYGLVLQTVHTHVVLGYDLLFWVCVIVLAIVFGIVALKMERNLFIIATSVCGAFLFTLSIDQLFLGGGHFNLSQLQRQHTSDDDDGRYFYCLTAGAIVLALLAMLAQKKLSNRHSSAESDGMPDVVYVQPEPRRRTRTSYFAV